MKKRKLLIAVLGSSLLFNFGKTQLNTKAYENQTSTVTTQSTNGDLKITHPGFTELTKTASVSFYKLQDNVTITQGTTNVANFAKITVNNQKQTFINMLYPGVYTVKYEVTIPNQNPLTSTRIVVVNDGTYKVGKNNILHAPKKFLMKAGTNVNNSAAIAKSARAKVYDKTSGTEITNGAKFSVTYSGTKYTGKLGEYLINLNLNSEPGLTIQTLAKVVQYDIIFDGEKPFLGARDRVIKNNTNFNPLDEVIAYDLVQGDITSKIEIQSNNVNTKSKGTYTIKYRVVGSKASQTKIVNIKVI